MRKKEMLRERRDIIAQLLDTDNNFRRNQARSQKLASLNRKGKDKALPSDVFQEANRPLDGEYLYRGRILLAEGETVKWFYISFESNDRLTPTEIKERIFDEWENLASEFNYPWEPVLKENGDPVIEIGQPLKARAKV